MDRCTYGDELSQFIDRNGRVESHGRSEKRKSTGDGGRSKIDNEAKHRHADKDSSLSPHWPVQRVSGILRRCRPQDEAALEVGLCNFAELALSLKQVGSDQKSNKPAALMVPWGVAYSTSLLESENAYLNLDMFGRQMA